MVDPNDVERQIRSDFGEEAFADFTDGFQEYFKRIYITRVELMELRQEITQIPLTRSGYRTQRRLGEKERDFQELSQRVQKIHEGMVVGHVEKISTLEGGSGAANAELRQYRQDGTIPDLVDRLEQTMAQVGQQLETKKNTANSRMVLVASGLAATAAFATLLVTVITIIL